MSFDFRKVHASGGILDCALNKGKLTLLMNVVVVACAALVAACTSLPDRADSSSAADRGSTTTHVDLASVDWAPEPSYYLQTGHHTQAAELQTPVDQPEQHTRLARPAQSPAFLSALRAGFRLSHELDNKRVQQEIAWIKRNPNFFRHIKPRVEKYLPYVCSEVARRDIPAELCLLPIIESALDPFAFSPGGAAGLWQFIPGTAKNYGLKIDWWVDERRDPFASTQAALDYLQALHGRFDDWLLAVASYNWGQARVARAVRKVGNDATFFDLRVPRETAGYVPRLLAFAAVFDDPQRYGIELPFDELAAQPRQLASVDTGGQIDVAKAADAVGITVERLYQYNPSLNQWATHPKGPHRILVPGDIALPAQRALNDVAPEERVAWVRHQIKPNQTLGGLARSYGTDVSTLKRVNSLRTSRIRVGDHLMIPKSRLASNDYPTPGRARESKGSIYVVRVGDSLWGIAKSFGISTQTLMRTNHIGPKDVLHVGQKVIVPGKSRASRGSTMRTVRYRVRNGDSLAKIAGKFNVSIRQIVGWNEIDPEALIHPGQKLVLYVDVTAPRT